MSLVKTVNNHKGELEAGILHALSQSKSLSTDTISFLIEQPSWKVYKEMQKLERWGLVSKTCSKTIIFWRLKQ